MNPLCAYAPTPWDECQEEALAWSDFCGDHEPTCRMPDPDLMHDMEKERDA